MPRRSAAAALETRDAILERSVSVASVEGLEGLTMGRLAGDLAMSKAGVIGHFGTKEELQLATLARALARFRASVWDPAADARPGRARLLAICDAWLSYLDEDVFPGGCFMTSASAEFDDRPGRVRDALVAAHHRWMGVLASEVRVAVAAGELPRSADPSAIAFQLNALAMGVNQALHLADDDTAILHAWRAMRAALGSPRARRGRGRSRPDARAAHAASAR
jgi:AcrR family transcriptional regulator